MGIECTFIDADAPEEEIEKAFRPNTKCLFGETISNPGINVLDIEKFARIAHKHGVPLIVDNTFATPINCRPFEWGADIVTHSTTKYMDGHATSVGGVIVDSGNFDWMAHADKFPGLTTPDESYHGLTYAKAFGKMAYITKATAQLMRDLGATPSACGTPLCQCPKSSRMVRSEPEGEMGALLRLEGQQILRISTKIPPQRLMRCHRFRIERHTRRCREVYG